MIRKAGIGLLHWTLAGVLALLVALAIAYISKSDREVEKRLIKLEKVCK